MSLFDPALVGPQALNLPQIFLKKELLYDSFGTS